MHVIQYQPISLKNKKTSHRYILNIFYIVIKMLSQK